MKSVSILLLPGKTALYREPYWTCSSLKCVRNAIREKFSPPILIACVSCLRILKATSKTEPFPVFKENLFLVKPALKSRWIMSLWSGSPQRKYLLYIRIVENTLPPRGRKDERILHLIQEYVCNSMSVEILFLTYRWCFLREPFKMWEENQWMPKN